MIHGPRPSVRETPGASASTRTFTSAPPVHFLSANVCIHLESFFFSVSFAALVTASSREEYEGVRVFASSPGGK